MLPGLRFLFTATVLSMSILIFGLGAAALLRAAHEEIASAPSRRPGPEPKFARQGETAAPVLALLRVEPALAEQKTTDNAPVAMALEPPPPIAAVPAEFDNIAALKPEDSSLPETANLPDAAKADVAASDLPAPREAAPAQADTPAAAGPARMAAIAEVVPPASEAAPTASEQANASASADTDPVSTRNSASTKIATLGGPPVTIAAQPATKAAGATSDANAAKKRLQAKRAKERRRLAQRARQAATQQPADPFSQPTITTRAR